MKFLKKICFVLIAFNLTFSLFAQVSVDPNDDFYQSAARWQAEGIVDFLPQVRPYSILTIKDIIETVKSKGTPKDVEVALQYENKYLKKWWNVEAEIQNETKVGSSTGANNYFGFRPAFSGDLPLFNVAGIGYRLGFLFDVGKWNNLNVLPMYQNVLNDNHGDPATIGPIQGKMDMVTNLTFGTKNMYGFLGLNRIEHGPKLSNSITIDGTSYHMANIGFNMDTKYVSYSHFISSMGAGLLNGQWATNNKYLAFHSVRVQPFKQWAFSFYETATVVDRFDPAYIVPVPFMMIQGMYGASDNLLMGVNTTVRPVDRLQLDAGLLIDDINVDGFFKGDWNTLLRIGLQTGVTYVPKNPVFEKMSLDYTLITPYTYNHIDTCYGLTQDFDKYKYTINHYSDYNKDSLITRNVSLTTPLGPNSDRLVFMTTLRPVKGLKIDASTSFARHGNIAESFSDEEAQAYLNANRDAKKLGSPTDDSFATDGSIWASQVSLRSRWMNNWLAQEHKMYVIQAGFDAQYDLITSKAGCFSFIFGYTFEAIINKGVDSSMYPAYFATASANAYDQNAATIADVRRAKQNWIDNLHNEFNNYFKVAFKYRY